MLSRADLLAIMPLANSRIHTFLQPLNAAMREFEINTPARQAAFLAQIGHESCQLLYVRELASGKAYDTGRLAQKLGNTPEADGDGQRYKGRGLIQITGKNNYASCGLALDLDLLSHPELLEEPIHACRSAAWFWKSNGLNELADSGEFNRICRIVNGGLNGLTERWKLYQKAREVLHARQTDSLP